MRRILNLATLAPSIVEAVVRGEEPSGLSLEKLAKGFPIPWEEQRNEFAFTPTFRPPVSKDATR